jgi:outer membrane protein
MRKPIFRIVPALLLCAGAAGQQPGTQVPMQMRPLDLRNSPRVHELIRAGNLYLSLSDALTLAIENNLDIEVERYTLPIADTDVLRTKGGGVTRGLQYILSETPAGVGGPLSPLVTNPAAGYNATPGSTIASNALELGVLGEPESNFSIQGTTPQSIGTPVPIFDPALIGQLNWNHSTTLQTNYQAYGTNALVSSASTFNAGVQQGFSTGTQVSLNFDNLHQNLNALPLNYNPFTGSSLGVTITQPLMRGFGQSLNRRFIRIAGNQQKISSLLFQQQLIMTVYGVVRLYTDLAALYEDVKVKQETLAAAQKLYEDTKAQVEEGTLAPVELTRANASVFSARQDLINARGLLEEQEAIVKNVLTKTGNGDPEVESSRLIPTDSLTIPARDEIQPVQDLMNDAVNRPDVSQAGLQLQNSQIGLEGARNLLKPEVDLVGVAQNNGLAGPINPLLPGGGPFLTGGYGSVLDQIFSRKYPTYGIGVQVTLPIRNRIAEADLAHDELQVRQSQVRLQQLRNQARLEVEDALIAMRRARASYEAAEQARALQQESLEAEQAKFEVGASTAFFVIQYESLLAQAKSTEVAAKSAYVKAKAALARATGSILDENHISFDAAYRGRK